MATGTDLTALERQALVLAKSGDFGPESVRINRAIVALVPTRESAWTRLGRSYLEQEEFDEAVTALRKALELNPANQIATNLLTETRRRRALKPSATVRPTTGFGVREFTLLETLSSDQACAALKTRIEALFDTLNATTIAQRIVATRQKEGEDGSKLFRSNSYYSGETGHIFAFHHGGRWEPQFNLGWFASSGASPACFRVGLGFNLTLAGRNPQPEEGQARVLQYFERFQRVVAHPWRGELVQWMTRSGGFIQYGGQPPATELMPEKAVEWLIARHDAATLGWVFCGRWLFLDKAEDAAILLDRSKVARVVDETFRTLFPIWHAAYAGPS